LGIRVLDQVFPNWLFEKLFGNLIKGVVERLSSSSIGRDSVVEVPGEEDEEKAVSEEDEH
jgi:hypothetical protein